MSRYAGTLRTATANPLLDLDDSVGQRQATFRFSIVDAVKGYKVQVYPLRDQVPTWSHDTGRTIKRQITGLYLGVDDTSIFNPVSSRLLVEMLVGGVAYPLGKYVPNTMSVITSTGGDQSVDGFYDEMYLVDQEISEAFSLGLYGTGNIEFGVRALVKDVPLTGGVSVEPTPYVNTASWDIGTRRGGILEQLAVDGDYFSPWLDNSSTLRLVRSFNPATTLPTFDLDSGNQVIRAGSIRTSNLITAPNRFVVISNGASGVGTSGGTTYATYDVPASAPHSIINRGGFVIQQTITRQLQSGAQALAVAKNLGTQYTLVEQIDITTVPDPRYESYDVVRWQGVNWLELSRSMQLVDGAAMQHTFRRSYS